MKIKKNNRIITVVLLFSILIGSLFGTNIHAGKKVKLNKTNISIKVGKSYRLKLKNNTKPVKWSSSAKSIASVTNKGKVTAKKVGIAKITAKAGKKKYICKVNVVSNKKTAPGELSENKSVLQTNNTPQITATPVSQPTSTPQVTETPTDNPAMSDAPSFVGFKTYAGKSLIDDSQIMSMAFYEEESLTKINYGEQLFLKLTYKNPKRDSIVEIVLNDSHYGNKQIYTSAASINKIISSDTYYDEKEDVYYTDVLLCMPVSKQDMEKRDIKVEEVAFLRETIGLQGYVDLSKARTTEVSFTVATNPVPNSEALFIFEKNENGYTVKGLNTNYIIPNTIYFPREYMGLPVNELAVNVLDDANVYKLIIPETIKKMRTKLTSSMGTYLKEVYIMGEEAPTLLYYNTGVYYSALESGECKVIVNEKALDDYINQKSGEGDVSWYWTYYDAKNQLYYFTEDGSINSVLEESFSQE